MADRKLSPSGLAAKTEIQDKASTAKRAVLYARFRDTFAVELLLAGVPLERVSVLLGHNSLRLTERHYSPWVRSRQEQLEQDLKRVWEQDPVALMETKGTPEKPEN